MFKPSLESLPRPQSRQPIPQEAQPVFQGKIFTVHQWQQPLFDGSLSTFEKLSRTDSVGILAVTEDKKIIVTKQEQPSMQLFYSLLGGVIDPGETPIETAKRELREEAGGEAADWQLWFSSQPVTKIDWAIYMFIAKEVTLNQSQQLDAGERIEVMRLTVDEFIAMTQRENFRDFEVALKILRMLHQGKRQELEQLLFGMSP